ncbi:MAG: adenylyltransferase/cytidyltransferase family protein [Parcubacteria group bacterium]|jgi:cytidyltransferase-like protein
MRKVMIFGTFDGIHEGHRDFFRQASEHGDHVMAVVARDKTVHAVKGKMPVCDECERIAAMLRVDEIDDVIFGYEGDDKLQVIRDHTPDVILLGYDQEAFVNELYDFIEREKMACTIVRGQSFHPEKYKSSLINEQ